MVCAAAADLEGCGGSKGIFHELHVAYAVVFGNGRRCIGEAAERYGARAVAEEVIDGELVDLPKLRNRRECLDDSFRSAFFYAFQPTA